MNNMNNVINIMKSICELMFWDERDVVRFDLQKCEVDGLNPWYVGYLYIKGIDNKRLLIRDDGSFNWVKR